jgi:adenosylhomocysteine nucleosidase
MTVGIIGALAEEVARIVEHLDGATTTEAVGRRFHHGEIGGRRVTVVESRIGKVAAAVTATTLIRDFDVEAIVFTGVAGALADDLAIGDVVVADALVQHDLAGPPDMFARGEIPVLGVRAIPTDARLRDAARTAAAAFLDGGLDEVVTVERLRELGIERPAVHVGPIATGDEFVHGAMKALVVERAPEAIAVDMEGAAVAQVCLEHGGVPLCVVRAISDLAAGTASVDFPVFLEALAQHYSWEIVVRMLAT